MNRLPAAHIRSNIVKQTCLLSTANPHRLARFQGFIGWTLQPFPYPYLQPRIWLYTPVFSIMTGVLMLSLLGCSERPATLDPDSPGPCLGGCHHDRGPSSALRHLHLCQRGQDLSAFCSSQPRLQQRQHRHMVRLSPCTRPEV